MQCTFACNIIVLNTEMMPRLLESHRRMPRPLAASKERGSRDDFRYYPFLYGSNVRRKEGPVAGPREFCVCVLRGCVHLHFFRVWMRSSAFISLRVRHYICVKLNMNASINLSY